VLDQVAKEEPKRISMEHPIIFIDVFPGREEKVVCGFFFIYDKAAAPKEHGETGCLLSERLAQPLHLIPQEGDFIRGFGVVSIHNKTRCRRLKIQSGRIVYKKYNTMLCSGKIRDGYRNASNDEHSWKEYMMEIRIDCGIV
jgi:hypothetical protein